MGRGGAMEMGGESEQQPKKPKEDEENKWKMC